MMNRYRAGSNENQCQVRLQAAQTESITVTSTSMPTAVASAAPDSGPKRAIAVATAGSKEIACADQCARSGNRVLSTFNTFIKQHMRDQILA